MRAVVVAALGAALLLPSGGFAQDQPPPPSRPPAPPPICPTNLKALALATLMYAQDHRQRLPRANGAAALDITVQPYLKNASSAKCPATTKPYLYNTALSGLALGAVADPAGTPMLEDAAPHVDGSVEVAFVDGHVKKYTAADAARLGGRFK